MSFARPVLGTTTLLAALAAGVGCSVLFDYSEERTPCAADADCDDANPCTDDACGPDGLCSAQAADHSAELLQQPGDCRVLVCEGGVVVARPDESDIPAEPCIDSVCQGTELKQTPRADGEACDVGSGHGYCEAGECVVACTADNAAAVCNDDNPCTDDTCDLTVGHCDHAPLTGDPPIPDEPRNCHALLCVQGELQDLEDDSDLPDDGNPCTDDVCSGGVPSNPLLPEGTPCGAAGVCDAAGTCVGCNSPGDCGGSTTECRWPTCQNDLCGTGYAPDGTVTNDQSGTGPCKERQCDGAGNTKIVDLPNGTSCNDGLYCNGSDSCSGGSCTHSGDPCPGPDGDGDCSESCNENADNCSANDPDGSSCNDGLYCNGADSCNSGSCSKHAGDPCLPLNQSNSDCSESCNPANGQCTANDPNGSSCDDGLFCTQADACNGSGTCSGSGSPCPGPDGDSDCTESCNESSNDCTANDPNGSACSGGTCIGGTCVPQ